MSVSNGQLANQTTFNSSFMSRETDTDTIGKVDLLNIADAASGPTMINLQRIVNSFSSAMGVSTAEAYDFLITWAADYVGVANDTVQGRIEAIVAAFHGTTGHTHDGTNGQGAKVSASDLVDINQYYAEFQSAGYTAASGTSVDVTTQMSGKSPNGGVSTVGVITTAPNNYAHIIDVPTNTFIEDAGGQRVYGRITESAGTWTLSFYTNEAGVETAHSLASTDIQMLFFQVFDLSTRPTIPSNPSTFGTLDVTGDVVDASGSQRGLVNLSAQSYAGHKTFNDGSTISSKMALGSSTDSSSTGADQTVSGILNPFLRLTNASLTSVAGIVSDSSSRIVFILNKSGAAITLKNNSVAASAANRVLIPGGLDLSWEDNQGLTFIYDTTASRWVLVGGAGSGGGGIAYQEVPSGLINGTNDTFGPLANTPSSDESIFVYVDGVLTRKSLYSITGGNTVVFNAGSIPQLGQDVYVCYLSSGVPAAPPVVSGVLELEFRTLTGGEATAEKIVLAATPADPAKVLFFAGGIAQFYGDDYTVVGDEIRWNGYSLSGVLSAGDKLIAQYVT